MSYNPPIPFGHIVTAMVTPFTDTGAIDFAEVQKLAKHLANNGTDAILIAGTTGEGPTLTLSERLELILKVRETVPDTIVIANIGTNNTEESVQNAEAAKGAGAQGLLCVMPYYNKPNRAGQLAHFRAVAQATDLPLMLYNIPSRCSAPILPEVLTELAFEGSICAVKEATGSVATASVLRTRTPDEFAIYSGDDDLTLPLLAVGASGVVSVASHIIGNELKEMCTAFFSGDWPKALTIHRKYLKCIQGLFTTTNPIPVKHALAHLNIISEANFRLPMTQLDELQDTDLIELLASYKML